MTVPLMLLYEELTNIVRNYPVFTGDTISHDSAHACGERGWAVRNHNGDWVPTQAGRDAFINYAASGRTFQ